MTRSRLRILGCGVAERRMHCSELVGGRLGNQGGSVQGVIEGYGRPLGTDKPGIHRGFKESPDPGSTQRLQEAHRRLRAQRYREQELPRGCWDAVQMDPDQPTQRRRHGQVLPRADRRARRHEGAREFEGVERVAARELLDPQERRPREAGVGGGAQQLVERPHREGFEPQSLDRDGTGRLRQAERRRHSRDVAALGDQESHRQTGKPSHTESKRIATGRVGPCRVVDGDQQRPTSGERPESGQDGNGDALRVGRLLDSCVDRIGDVVVTQCPTQNGAVDLREASVDRCKGRSQQVAERGVGIVGLGLDGPCKKDDRTRGLRRCHPGPQQARLPDSGRPFDQDGQRIDVRWSNAGHDARNCLIPPDQGRDRVGGWLSRGGVHPAGILPAA
ncbi:MAG: hypothetical protein P4L30_10110 [Candidatus Limnocylindrales bacterium]|nr:hypothetical protein [Candidatus Limnocylindrales bacterium]